MSELDDDLRSAMKDFPADESGDVDLSLLRSCLDLTIPQRLERHYRARVLVSRLQSVARERYGTLLDDLAAVE